MKGIVRSILLIALVVCVAGLVLYSEKTSRTGTGNGAGARMNTECETLVSDIVSDCIDDRSRVNAIRKWIADNISYDYEEKAVYQHFDIEKTLRSRKGVCYDYAHLFAVMCRYLDIPCYIIDGIHKDDSSFRHSWNRVYFDECWWSVDTTFDSTAAANGKAEYGIRKIGSNVNAEDENFFILRMY